MFRNGFRGKRGQISVEHLFILSLAILILIPGTVLFYQFSKTSNDQLIANQVKRIGDEIIKNSEIVYYLGDGSRLILDLNFPKTIKYLNISNDEIVMKFTSYSGNQQAVFFPEVSMEGNYSGSIFRNFHTGTVRMVIENINGAVYIREFEY